jgi:hypothetical protein
VPQPTRLLAIGEYKSAVHQPQVGQRLLKVSHQPLGPRVVLLAERPHVVAWVEQPLEELLGLLPAAYAPKRVHQPEAADQERAFVPGETVV